MELHFIGVTTGQSAMVRIFPRWMQLLGIPGARMVGVDLPLDATRDAYRQAVERMRAHGVAGGLVTTHKINLVEAARDLFDSLDPDARATGELNCIVRRNGSLHGYAKDPLAARLALAPILGPNYFGRTGGEVLLLGAGGAATAIALQFLRQARAGRPSRIVMVERSEPRAKRACALLAPHLGSADFEMHPSEPGLADKLVSSMPPASLIVNATGMGKDLPGSPISAAARFPAGAIAWDLNYRGELLFLEQARAQRVTVADGWDYFLHGWTQVLAEVYRIVLNGAVFERLAAIAGENRYS